MVLDFLFFKFICPAIINPQRSGLISEDVEVPLNSRKNFVVISKILNDVTHNTSDKYDVPSIRDCISNNYGRLVEGMVSLLDTKKIEKAKAIVEASTTEVVYTLEEKRHAEVKLRELLDTILRDSPIPTPVRITPSKFSGYARHLLENWYVENSQELRGLPWTPLWSFPESPHNSGSFPHSRGKMRPESLAVYKLLTP
jgi:hypothetical protein